LNTTSPKVILKVENLKVSIHTDRDIIHAVNGVSFELYKGRTLGIVGESGSGKSILCKSILRLLPQDAIVPEDATFHFNGYRPLESLSAKEFNKIRGREIAMVFQDPMTCLNPVMTIGNQMSETLVHHLGIKRKNARDRVIELMNTVGIPMPEQRWRQYPHQLSGGICQRAAIAMALSCDPKLLIADEPTTALDVTVQAEILDLLALRQSGKDMSMILISHDLGVVAGRADDIMVMYAGKIVEKAPAKELFLNMRMPYTRALMNSIPPLDRPPHTRLATIEGNPPALVNPVEGCAFAPRCFKAQEQCIKAEPMLRADERDNHLFACWFPLEGDAL